MEAHTQWFVEQMSPSLTYYQNPSVNQFTAPTALECFEFCSGDVPCLSWTYDISNHTCFMFDDVRMNGHHDGFTAGIKVLYFLCTLLSCDSPCTPSTPSTPILPPFTLPLSFHPSLVPSLQGEWSVVDNCITLNRAAPGSSANGNISLCVFSDQEVNSCDRLPSGFYVSFLGLATSCFCFASIECVVQAHLVTRLVSKLRSNIIHKVINKHYGSCSCVSDTDWKAF